MKATFLVSATVLMFIFALQSALADSTEDFLRAFHQNPKKMMDQLPSQVTIEGRIISRGSIDERKVEERIEQRETDKSDFDLFLFASPDKNNNADAIVDQPPAQNNLPQMEQQGLMKALVSVIPWTDSYWPLFSGMIGNRYADPSFPNTPHWQENRSYIDSHPAAAIAVSGDSEKIDSLSPAEKYDLAMGDKDFTLSGFAWAQGKRVNDLYGRVAKWMGICHGWAAAAHMNALYPPSPITVLSPSGIPITFHPQDIKALQSMLWANASSGTRFIGSRCKDSNPKKNSNGRIISPDCFDVNPGTWHQALIHQTGAQRRSLIIDSTFDIEVWNYPVSTYDYEYFNPQSLKTGTLKASAIPVASFKIDKFRDFRSATASFIVGIKMNVTYVMEIKPTRGQVTEPPTKTIRLIYDLELDDKFNIIGGEWYTNGHPDFLWTYSLGTQAAAPEDARLADEVWTLDLPVPPHWGEQSKSAARRGRPLFSFIRRLTGQ